MNPQTRITLNALDWTMGGANKDNIKRIRLDDGRRRRGGRRGSELKLWGLGSTLTGICRDKISMYYARYKPMWH